jgi:hypothetical protein
MEMKVVVGIILGLIALGILIYIIGFSSGVFDNIMGWLSGLME